MKRLIYGTALSPKRVKDTNGQLVCFDVPISKVGQQDYNGEEIGIDDAGVVSLIRNEEDVYETESLASFENMPLTIQHPEEDVIVGDNFKDLAVGFVKNVRKGTLGDEKVVYADLVFYDEEAIENIENREMEEVSVGYDCKIEKIGDNYYQKAIRGNHLALVERGRAGIAKIGDKKVIEDMPTKTYKIKHNNRHYLVKANDEKGAIIKFTDRFSKLSDERVNNDDITMFETSFNKFLSDRSMYRLSTAIKENGSSQAINARKKLLKAIEDIESVISDLRKIK